MSTKAVVHVKTVRRPISDEIIGFRLEAAIPNEAGRVMKAKHVGNGELDGFYATDEVAPSFRKPYFICDRAFNGKKDIERLKEDLAWYGYKEVQYVGRFGGMPLAEFVEGM